MINPDIAVSVIQAYQVAILAPLLNPRAVNNWLFQKENAHFLKTLADVSDAFLTFLKHKTIINLKDGETKIRGNKYHNLPNRDEMEFIGALIGKNAAESFFTKVYPLYRSDVKKEDKVQALPIDTQKLNSLLNKNRGLCFAIQQLSKNSKFALLNKTLPKDLVPAELLLANNYVDPNSIPVPLVESSSTEASCSDSNFIDLDIPAPCPSSSSPPFSAFSSLFPSKIKRSESNNNFSIDTLSIVNN